MNDTVAQAPLYRLKGATAAYMDLLRDELPVLKAALGDNRLVRQINAAFSDRRIGTPAGIALVLAHMLGELGEEEEEAR